MKEEPIYSKDNEGTIHMTPPRPDWKEEFKKKFGISGMIINKDSELFVVGDWLRRKEVESFISSLLTRQKERMVEVVEEKKKPLPKDPLDVTPREVMNQIIQPVYRRYVSNEESYNLALSDTIQAIREIGI